VVPRRDPFYSNLTRHRCYTDTHDFPPPAILAAQDGGNDDHETLVNLFCSNLQASKEPAYAEIDSCAIDFTYELSHPHQQPSELGFSRWERNGDSLSGEIGVQFDIGPINDDTDGVTDMSDIGLAFVDSYNEVHPDSPWYLSSFNLERLINYPIEDDDGDDDEVAKSRGFVGRRRRGGSSGWGRSGANCNHCPSRMLASSAPMLTANRHKAWELVFCHKLKISSTNYNNLRYCEIRFTANDSVHHMTKVNTNEELGLVEA
jgi:hypothetical protein